MLKTPCLIGLCAAVLTACTSVTPAGLRAAMQLDPLETPPAALSVAVSVPRNVALSDGDVFMSLGFVPEDAGVTEPVLAKVPLSVVESGTAPAPRSPEDRVYVLMLDQSAALELAAAQSRIQALKAQRVKGQGSLSVAVEGGCVEGLLENSFPVATWLRPNPAEDFVQLTRRTDFFAALDQAEAQALRAQLLPC